MLAGLLTDVCLTCELRLALETIKWERGKWE